MEIYSVLPGKKLIVLSFLLFLAGVTAVLHILPPAAATDREQTTGEIDIQGLAGRWVRPDGGYILELREFGKDGTMKATYFNPGSVKVFRAEWSRREGRINLYIELRDANYPGSFYRLRYDPGTDRLPGIYFQAMVRETYDIEFMRSK